MQISRIIVAGTHSGAGKTTLTLGLLRALTRRGVTVQPFKVGPDFIDPTLHTAAVTVPGRRPGPARISRNLDTWLLAHHTAVELFARAAEGAGAAVIEGVMGLYDGIAGSSESGSTAEVAKVLRAPVLLVLDVAGSVRSAAATAMGFGIFDPDLTIAGVIANRTGGARHEGWVRDSLAAAGIPLLGVLPWDDRLRLPERHLGLVPAGAADYEDTIEVLADAVLGHIDVDAILKAARSAPPVVVPGPSSFPPLPVPEQATVGVARDAAFGFYYQDGLDLLAARGARLAFFSPLHDRALPDVDGLYLGGGFPEVHAAELAGNVTMRARIRDAVGSGMPVYAECGGMMYLAQAIVDAAGTAHDMVGAIPAVARMQPHLGALSYVTLEATRDTLLLQAGEWVRAHEFHYSRLEPTGPLTFGLHSDDGRGVVDGADGICTPTLLACYAHVHLASHPVMAERFVEACRHFRTGSGNRDPGSVTAR